MKIGILFIATGRYMAYMRSLHADYETYFLPGYEKFYYLFTDAKAGIPVGVSRFEISHRRWPGVALRKFHYILSIADRLRADDIDVLYLTDADMRVVARVGEEVLPTETHPLVATTSPNHAKATKYRRSFEDYPGCTAYVSPNEPAPCYVRSGFMGGKREAYLKAITEMRNNTNKDLKKGLVAKWHDESYWNRYFLDHQTAFKVLGHEYCFTEDFDPTGYQPKIIDIRKPYHVFRPHDGIERLGHALLGESVTNKIRLFFFMLWHFNFSAIAFRIRQNLNPKLRGGMRP